MCFDSLVVRREQQPAKSRGRGRGTCRGTSRGTERGTGRGTCRGTSRGTGRGTGKGTDRGIDSGTVRGICRGIDKGTGGVSSQQPDQPRAMGDSISTGRQKRTKTVGFGIYTNASCSQTFNPGTSGERVITPGVYKDAALKNIDIGYKPRGLKWNSGDAVTASQLQRISQSRKNKRGTSSAPRNA
ncbi:hypothetical protein KY290_024715 [Solanum tuberosum]|uniref:Transposon MuDR mudrA n=1 Tax=Solanum tuberosum TaxID=4113 RepID=A0ABQ7URG2_SOLTU|nr:hypothetical protein KY284_023570 [Solanum tuberosum]KAH0754445.1 hypothetical protein KY290_024715 [Solanum tuberosum]